jgi:hypothetical protein
MPKHRWLNAFVFAAVWVAVVGVALNFYRIVPDLPAKSWWYTSLWFLYGVLAVCLVFSQLVLRAAQPHVSYGHALAAGARVSLLSAIGMGVLATLMNAVPGSISSLRDPTSVFTALLLAGATLLIGLLESGLTSIIVMKR